MAVRGDGALIGIYRASEGTPCRLPHFFDITNGTQACQGVLLQIPSLELPVPGQDIARGNNLKRIVMMSNVFLNTKKMSFAMLAASLLLPAGLLAQSGAGSIQGTVQDASSAALVGCSVHVVNQSTGVVNDTTSNSSGFYSVPGLFAGKYTLTFSAPGMKKYQAMIALQDAQNAVLNPKLTVGDVAEQVTVTGDAVQLATYDSGTVSTELDSNRIDQLPQNGRNVLGLAQNTVPGVEAGGTRANGLMGEAMEYSQDGAPMTNRNFGGEANTAASHSARPGFRAGSES